LRSRNIQFHLLYGEPPEVLPDFVKNTGIGGVVCDFAPLRVPMKWVSEVSKRLPPHVPFCQVDAHNVVPCWVASDKLEHAARTIRPKINAKLKQYLTHFPPLIVHPYESEVKCESVNWEDADNFLECDRAVEEVTWLKPGATSAFETLFSFLEKRIKRYIQNQGGPLGELSNMSPFFHFGQIAPQRVILGKFCTLSFKSETFIIHWIS